MSINGYLILDDTSLNQKHFLINDICESLFKNVSLYVASFSWKHW